MKRFLVLFLFTFQSIYSQQDLTSILDFTLSYRGLTQKDITIPVNFDKEKSPRNDAKLLLPVVKDLMQEPMKSFEFMDSVLSYLNLEIYDLMRYNLYPLVTGRKFATIHDGLKGITFLSFTDILLNEIKNLKFVIPNKAISNEEKKFLSSNLMSVISESENETGSNSDIFKFNKARDSSIAVSKKTLDILSKLDLNRLIHKSTDDFIFCHDQYQKLRSGTDFLDQNYDSEELYNKHVQGNFFHYYDKEGIRIAIGGKEKNIYNGHFDFIIDLGGDDVYNIDRESDDLFENNFSCIIDLSGNDYYSTNSNYSLAGAVFSSGFIFDKEGDDTYKAKNVSLGSAICGLGVLYDESGNDTYQANQFSIGAASFGVGLLVDRSGNDVYVANSYSQGFGMTEGVGAIVDNNGNDNYLIDARSLDIGRYEDHYVSMSQGYGLGLRPYYAGGIGLIIEGGGNDFYSTDIFGQGGAYWYGLGCILDKSGHDKYNSYQYAQGAGIHLAVGLLKDYDGWDFYTSDGVSQGCGHDFGFGLLYDVKGNDNYSAYSLSQGAGNANGIGILIDESGRDGYLNKEPNNTRGYGNSRREYGSLGIFLDASGDDYYSVGGLDSVMSNSSMWGVMNDYFLTDQKSQASGNTFKIRLDSIRNYTQDELFIMAKTIEPRFSQWQEYGFRKLAEDSLNTPQYILKFLDTDDHRDGLVLRNLSQKIFDTMGIYFTEQLRQYNLSMRIKPIFNQNEVAFICYLFGETRNPAGKEELLNLTHDENIRVRSIAVNALGKIPVDSNDTDFNNRVSHRLRELAAENSQYKLFNKDIAYAFKNYKNFDNIATLISLMGNDYFGVRFLASEDLRSYGETYFEYINKEMLNKYSDNRIWFQSFLNSLEALPDGKFKEAYEISSEYYSDPEDEINLNRLDLLKKRLTEFQSDDIRLWAEELIRQIQSNSNLKIN